MNFSGNGYFLAEIIYCFAATLAQICCIVFGGDFYSTIVTSIIVMVPLLRAVYGLSSALIPLPLIKFVLTLVASIFLIHGVSFVGSIISSVIGLFIGSLFAAVISVNALECSALVACSRRDAKPAGTSLSPLYAALERLREICSEEAWS